MGSCGTCGDESGGPFSEGRELVQFVMQAHGGAVADSPVPNGGLETKCQGCGESFTLKTFVDTCPKCGGVHAVSPPRCDNADNIQFAGTDFKLV
ncbi:MAG: hypothetical protein OEZ13_12440 [Spirochaetia bacterium]|nr:hypothetical protein [Spirochaetia bacterium]